MMPPPVMTTAEQLAISQEWSAKEIAKLVPDGVDKNTITKGISDAAEQMNGFVQERMSWGDTLGPIEKFTQAAFNTRV